MTTRRLLLATAFAATLPLAAHAQWYAGPALLAGFTDTSDVRENSGTATFVSDDTDGSGATAGAAALLGYDFSEADIPMALEFSGNWRARHDQNIGYQVGVTQFGVKSNVQTFDFMASLLYDLPLGTRIQPFVGGGVGVAHIMADNEFLTGGTTDIGDSNSTNFAWQLQGGVKYPLDDSMKLRVDYRYIDMGDFDTTATPGGQNFTADVASHDVRIGVTWDF